MPAYSQIVYGHKGPDAIARAAAALGLTLTADGQQGAVLVTGPEIQAHLESDDMAHVEVEVPQEVQDRLLAAYKRALGLLPGHTYLGGIAGTDEHAVDTPWGRRKADGFTVYVFYIYGEADGDPSDAALGFALTSRYTPVLLDLEDAHGGYSTLDLSVLPTLGALFQEAFPEWPDARFFVKETFA